MKTYDIEVQRLKSARHDKGVIELGVDVLVLPRPGRDDAPATSGLRLALVSSDSEANARRQLGETAALFSHFDCAASIFGKPAKFRRILRRTGISAA